MSQQKRPKRRKNKRRRTQVRPHHIDPSDRINNFEEVNLGYLRQDEVFVEAKRCYSCRKPQCVQACPGNFDVRNMLTNIQEAEYQKAADIVNEFYCFPESFNRVCPAFCQDACIAGRRGDPINILHIKRWLSENYTKPLDHYKTEPPTGIKIGIVGSGPAGLTAAHALAKMGHKVTIFEKFQTTGGMLAVGIPEYRLPKRILQSEIKDLEKFGIEIITGIEFGRDLELHELEQLGYKAVLFAHGAHQPKWMGIPGEDLPGVMHAIEFLRKVALDHPVAVGDRVAIVGGGDVAIDAARVAYRLGKKPVILYRRTKEQMPATKEEIEETENEQIPIEFLTNPVSIVGENKVEGIEVINMELGEPDDSGRRRPIPIEGTNHVIPIDTVIIAISQQPEDIFPDVELTRWNTFDVGKTSFMTDVPGVFAAGDNVSGPKTAIEAIVQGKKAAEEIHEYVQRFSPREMIEIRQ